MLSKVGSLLAKARQALAARSSLRTLQALEGELSEMLERLVDPSSALAASFEQVRGAIEARMRGIFRVDRPPL